MQEIPERLLKDLEDTVVSQRYYLADADFLVGLEGPVEMLAALDVAVAAPVLITVSKAVTVPLGCADRLAGSRAVSREVGANGLLEPLIPVTPTPL